jgi:hypothetical protein
MLTFFRTRTRSFMIIMLVIIGISFLFLYNASSLQRLNRTELGSIDGQTVTQDQFRLAYQACRFWQGMNGSQNRGGGTDMLNRQSWNRLLMLASAKNAGMAVTDAEVTDFIKTKLGFLQKNGQFDPAMWAQFSSPNGYLSSQGISGDRFIEIIREELTLEKLQTSLTAPVQVSPTEVRDTFDKLFTPVHFQIIKFEAKDYLSQVKATDEEIAKEYQENDLNPDYRIPDRRTVAYARFDFPPTYAKAADKEKEEIKNGLGKKALALATELLGDGKTHPDFDTVAKNAGVTTALTKPFGPREAVEGLPPSPSFNAAAFRLKTEEPVSEPVETSFGYCVLYLKDIKAGAPKPLAEVRPQLEASVKLRKAAELANKAGNEAGVQLKVTMAITKDFKTAATSLKLKVEDAPEFVPMESRSMDPVLQVLAPLSASLKPGQTSEYQRGPSVGVIAYFKERGKVDEKKFQELLPALQGQMENQRKTQVVEAWFKQRTASPGTRLPSDLFRTEGPAGL